MSNPFEELDDLESVKTGDVPLQQGLIAVIHNPHTAKDEDGVTRMKMDLYFPEFGATRNIRWPMNNTDSCKKMIVSVLHALEIPTSKEEKHMINERYLATEGWTVKVDHYESKATDKNGNPYRNFRIRSVVEKTEPDTPF